MKETFVRLLLCGVLLLGGCTPRETVVTLYYTNDSHARILSDADHLSVAGMDYIAAAAAAENALLVDVGDTFHGLPIAAFFHGQSIVRLMNAAGYEIMVLGNHDFNYGLDTLLALQQGARFDLISANVLSKKEGTRMFPGEVIKERAGVRIGFFGLTTRTTYWQTKTENVASLEFGDYLSASRASIARLRAQGAQVIVCLAHVKRSETLMLADSLTGAIDLIIDGHDHIAVTDTVKGMLVTSAGCYENFLGEVTLRVNARSGRVLSIDNRLIPAAELHSRFSPRSEVTQLLQLYERQISRLFDQKIGVSKVRLSAARGSVAKKGVRNSEQPLGDLVADALRSEAQSDLAVFNSGGLREDVSVGAITHRSISNAVFYGNYLVVKEVTGKQLWELFENSVKSVPEPFGGFLQVSGCRFVFDPRAEEGSRVLSVTVGQTPLDTLRGVYSLATNDFLASGGDEATLLRSACTLWEGRLIDQIVADYIARISPLTVRNTTFPPRIIEK